MSCPECGASGIIQGLFGSELAIREHDGWNECKKCGYTWSTNSDNLRKETP